MKEGTAVSEVPAGGRPPCPAGRRTGLRTVALCCAVVLGAQVAASAGPTEAEALKKEELRVAEDLLAALPSSVDALGLLGSAYHHHGNAAEAVRCWEECLRRDPKRPDAYYALAEVALHRGQFKQAETLCRNALALYAELPGGHRRLAQALLRSGKIQQAIAAMEQGVKIAPRSSNNHYFLAQAYLQAEAYEKAERHFRIAVEIHPEHTNAYYGLATACARLGRWKQAGEYRKKFQDLKAADRETLRREKRHIDAETDLAAICRNAALTHTAAGQMYHRRGNADRARQLWARAAQLDPKNTRCRLELARLHQKNNRLAESLRIFEQLAQIEPNNVKHHASLGVLNARLKRPDAAEKAFKRVIQLAPQGAAGDEGLARLYMSTNTKLADARVLAETAARLSPSAWSYFLLSEACRRTADRAGARAAMKKAVELEPHNAHYRRLYEQLRGGK